MSSKMRYRLMSWGEIKKGKAIGKGGASVVYMAKMQPEGRKVAVKIRVDVDVEDDVNIPLPPPELYLRYEAHMMSRLRHPNIVALHGLIPSSPPDGVPAGLVMEYMPNGNLLDALEDARADELLPWRSRVSIALQVAKAMQHMHSAGFVHLDLKASNLCLDLRDPARPVCKVGDMGLARDRQRRGMSLARKLGTLGYMAPELAGEEGTWPRTVTEKVDVYSFGMVMWELLTGTCPLFEEEDMRQVLREVEVDDHVLLSHPVVPEWCYSHWRGLMEDCWTRDAARRPAFGEVARKLRDMLADFSAAATSRGSSIDVDLLAAEVNRLRLGHRPGGGKYACGRLSLKRANSR